jgi:hypothetical protein
MDSSKQVKAHFVPQGAAEMLASNAAATLGLVPASRVDEARQATLEEVAADPKLFGYYNRDQVQGLALGRPLLEKNSATGKMMLSLGLKRSGDLKSWQNLPMLSGDVSVHNGKMSVQITPEGKAEFYILEGAPQ